MCEYCDGREKRIENGFTYGNAHIAKTNFGYTYSLRYDNSANEYGEGAFEINYCPICGRRLTEEEKDPINICKTNPDCEHNPEDCGFSINCTTIEDSIQGKESYVCGFEPCKYEKRRN